MIINPDGSPYYPTDLSIELGEKVFKYTDEIQDFPYDPDLFHPYVMGYIPYNLIPQVAKLSKMVKDGGKIILTTSDIEEKNYPWFFISNYSTSSSAVSRSYQNYFINNREEWEIMTAMSPAEMNYRLVNNLSIQSVSYDSVQLVFKSRSLNDEGKYSWNSDTNDPLYTFNTLQDFFDWIYNDTEITVGSIFAGSGGVSWNIKSNDFNNSGVAYYQIPRDGEIYNTEIYIVGYRFGYCYDRTNIGSNTCSRVGCSIEFLTENFNYVWYSGVGMHSYGMPAYANAERITFSLDEEGNNYNSDYRYKKEINGDIYFGCGFETEIDVRRVKELRGGELIISGNCLIRKQSDLGDKISVYRLIGINEILNHINIIGTRFNRKNSTAYGGGEGIYFPLYNTDESPKDTVIDGPIDVEGSDEGIRKLLRPWQLDDVIGNTFTWEDIPNDGKWYWNESVEEIAKKIIKLFDFYSDEENKNDTPLLADGSTIITKIKDLRYADAGNSFEKEPGTKWVVPYQNIDSFKYGGVRNKDKVLDILGNPNKTDRTREKVEVDGTNTSQSFISLLMPKYGRRVEIEDFNRNFWVIAQIVDGMSAWIFEKSPLPEIIQKMLDETIQLWENILYLWLYLALKAQKKSFENLSLTSSIKILQSEDLLRYESNPVAFCEREGDNFNLLVPSFNFMDEEIGFNEMKNNPLIDLEDTYSQQDLCYISKIKFNNYRKNYYEGECFNQIYFSVLNGKQGDEITERNRTSYEIYEEYQDNNGNIIQRPLIVSVGLNNEPIEKDGERRFTPYLLGAANVDRKVFIGYPFSETKNYLVENKRENLYCGIRAIPSVYITRKDTGEKIVSDFTINIYDAINSIFVENNKINNQRLIGYYEMKEIIDNKIIMVYHKNNQLKVPDFLETDNTDFFNNYTLKETAWETIDFSYYLGECVSTKEKTSRITNIQDILESKTIFLKLGNLLPSGVKNSQGQIYSTTPVPSFCMSTLAGNVVSQIRGDFTFDGIPTYFNVPSNSSSVLNASNIQIKDDINIDRNFITNAFGKTDLTNEIGLIYYYYFDWENYIPEKDIPGNTISNLTESINSINNSLCFNITGANGYFKTSCDNLTEENVLKQGIQVVKNYLIKTKNCANHFHSELYKKPCSFATLIGIAPYCITGEDTIKQRINAVCHILRYFPHPDFLEFEEGEQKNYYNFYNNNLGSEIKEGDTILGKIIYKNFVNRYDSYYDFYPFENMVNLQQNEKIYTTINDEAFRGIYLEIDKEKNYCKRITINSSYDEYKINFTPEFFGTIKYYDFGKAKQNAELKETIENENDSYQISSGDIEIESTYSQKESGAICPYDNKKNFYTRSNIDMNRKETNEKDTGFLHIDKENKKQYPFDDGAINNKQSQTQETLFGINNGKLCQTVYTLNPSSDIPTKENPMPNSDKYYSISDNNLPDWIILVNFNADSTNNDSYYNDNNNNIFNFSYCKITKNNSELNAYIYFYNYLNENFRNNTHSYSLNNFQWFASNNFILEKQVNYINGNPQFTLIDKKNNNYYYIISEGGEVVIDNNLISYPNNEKDTFNVKYYQNNSYFVITQNKDNNPFKLYFKNIYPNINLTSLPSEKYLYLYDNQNKKAVYFNTNDRNSSTELSLKTLKLLGIKGIFDYSTEKFGTISGLLWSNSTPPSSNTIQIDGENYNIESCNQYCMTCNYFGKVIISNNNYEKIYLETSEYDNSNSQKIYYVLNKNYVNIDAFEKMINYMENFSREFLIDKIKFLDYDKKIFVSVKKDNNDSNCHYVNIEKLEYVKTEDEDYFIISPYRAPFDQIYY